MPAEDIEMNQDNFMHQGGIYQLVMAQMKKDGRMARSYEYREYPKMIRVSKGVQTIDRVTQTVDKQDKKWKEEKEVFEEFIVHSEEEEERILAGGLTSTQIEEERQTLIRRCRANGVNVDPSWSMIRLKRELGDKMDAPEPVDDLATLQKQLAALEEKAALRKRIAELEAQLGAPAAPADERDDLRAQLAELGVDVDKRWAIARLREELELATAPEKAVA